MEILSTGFGLPYHIPWPTNVNKQLLDMVRNLNAVSNGSPFGTNVPDDILVNMIANLDWLVVDSAPIIQKNVILNVDFAGAEIVPINRDLVAPVDFLLTLNSVVGNSIDWTRSLNHQIVQSPDWLNDMAQNSSIDTSSIGKLLLNRGIDIEYAAPLNRTLYTAIESLTSKLKATTSATNYLQAILSGNPASVDWSGTIVYIPTAKDLVVSADWVRELKSSKTILEDLIGGLLQSNTMPFDWTGAPIIIGTQVGEWILLGRDRVWILSGVGRNPRLFVIPKVNRDWVLSTREKVWVIE